jgi:GNAT superfamily N-acetyltransferase
METTLNLPTLNLQPSNLLTVNIRDLDEPTARQINAFWNRIRKERLPDDPPIPFEEDWQGWQNFPDFEELNLAILFRPDGEEVIATAECFNWLTEDNQHLLFFEINVAPEHRRQGLGKRMLRQAAEVAVQKGKRLMMTESHSRVPAGEAFMQRLGASAGMHSRTNQLRIADIDRSLLARWQDSHRNNGFRLGFWDGAYPEEQLDNVVDLFKIVHDEPREDLQIEDHTYTAEQLRQMEKEGLARGVERWTVYVQETSTARFCGFSEVFWNPNRPFLLWQGFTGVNPDFRGKSLGRWMKAAMLARILDERPYVQVIRTGNANSNRYMLAINNELGFKPYLDWTVWQIDTEKVLSYLE